MKHLTSYMEERRGGRVRAWSARSLAALTTAVAMTGTGIVTGAPASATETWSDEVAAMTDSDREAEVAEARVEAALMEQQRVQELMDQGMSRDEAATQVLAEQNDAAEEGRLRIIELTLQGLTPQQIADATPGMVLVSTEPEAHGPQSSNGDLSLPRGAHHFFMQCSCDELSATWQHTNDLENDSMDVVGIRATESVQNLGGSIQHCDTGPSPDQCHLDGSVDFEDPQGVAHDFQSEEGERGIIAFSARQYSADGPGPCQMFSHYHHAWSSVTVTGVSISADNFSVTFGSVDQQWRKQTAGPGVAC